MISGASVQTRIRAAVYQAVLAGALAIHAGLAERNDSPSVERSALFVAAEELSIDARNGLRVLDGWPFTGVAIQEASDGQIISEEPYQRGRRNGTLRRWFDNGQLAFASEYEKGRREGVTISWWRNGMARSFTRYDNDRPDGVALQWYRGGQRFKRLNYEDGRPVGLQQGWRQNGKLFSNFEFRGGRIYGLRNANLCVELSDEELVFSD